ncbi:hypothetical protein [Thermococcus barophilus]|uniref:KaiC-like domain-containing protein n=1 Tax=Thermococcus barophilus TaxID=55802 RepID=A0A0S1XDS3_THEBA|nr:hypothetical protein [Thermococcus barophilus]ALM75946.1 hypothetical protein TBCH5v1_2043 [Thermococcus barophilus]
MPVFFRPAGEEKRKVPLIEELSPLVGEVEEGSMVAVVTTDALSQTILQYSALANALNSGMTAYYLEPTNGFSLKLLNKLSENNENLFLGKVYTLDELSSALELVEDNSLVFVSNFSILENQSREKLIKMRRIVDEKSLFLVLSHNTLEINELDLNSEFKRLFVIPELFEHLLVLRTSGYRGHYRMNISVLKAPPEFVKNIGEHSIPIDKKAKMFLV